MLNSLSSDFMKKPLSKLERAPLRETWKHEANLVERLL